MGASWQNINELNIGDVVYAQAGQFDQPDETEKYSDFFEHKEKNTVEYYSVFFGHCLFRFCQL